MKIFHIFITITLLYIFSSKDIEIEKKLDGIPISSDSNSEKIHFAFDGDLSTNFQSSEEYGWIGKELKYPSKITKIGYYHNAPDENMYLLGTFQGANDINFYDAVTLFMIKEVEKKNEINYIDISCDQIFKYIRYIGPTYSESMISEFEIYGIEYQNMGPIPNPQNIYQPTNIPLLIINTENGTMLTGYDKEIKLESNIMIIDNKKIKTNNKAKIKLRGNSSLNADKKSYSLTFEEKTKILDIPSSSKKYVAIANFYDKTLLRNILGYEISSFIKLKYTPSCRYVDLIFNGFYQGYYIICEKIDVDKDKINITKMDKKCKREPAVSGGYIIEGDGNGQKDKSHFKTNKGLRFSIKYPKLDDLIENQYNYISNKFNEIEKEIFEDNIDSIDIESFAKYFIVEDFCANVDMIYNSIYLYKERSDDKLYFGPVWDMDMAFDNSYILYPTNEKINFAYKFTLSNGPMKQVVSKMLSNRKILQKIKDVWNDITNNGFNKEYLINFIDEKYKLIYESQKLNFLKWKILGARVFMEGKIFETYEEEVEYLKKFITDRFETFGKIIMRANYNSVLEEYKTQWDDMGQIEDDGKYGWDI